VAKYESQQEKKTNSLNLRCQLYEDNSFFSKVASRARSARSGACRQWKRRCARRARVTQF